VTDELLLATVLRRRVKSEDLEHDCVGRDEAKLVEEVVLVFVGPSVDIIGLNLDLERPVRLRLLITILVKLGELHNRHGASMVSNLSQVLTNRFTGTGVLHLSEDVRPTVFKEVIRGLTVEGEHGKPICGGHAVSEELHAVTWSSVGHNGLSLSEFGNSHNSVLATSKNACVGRIVRGNELHQSSRSNRVRPLYSSGGHSVRDGVEREVHVLLEES